MKTLYLRVQTPHPEDPAIQACVRVLRRGGLVAFPTETVYGLGADALEPEAVAKIFKAKGRPADNPLIVHAADADRAFELASDVPGEARRLADAFWPGPLTMVLPRADHVPLETTAGLDTVAVRVPAHAVALAFLVAYGSPIAAPSANVSGRPSPTKASHVLQDLDGKIDAVLDGGPTGVGVESTVLDVTVRPPRILRPGGVTEEALTKALGAVTGPSKAPHGETDIKEARSPGMKYRHYAPKAEAVAVHGSPADVARALTNLRNVQRKSKPGFLISRETLRLARWSESDPTVYVLGQRTDVEEAARRFYDGLRQLDHAGVAEIYIEAYPAVGLGVALYDRLVRATQGKALDAAAYLRSL